MFYICYLTPVWLLTNYGFSTERIKRQLFNLKNTKPHFQVNPRFQYVHNIVCQSVVADPSVDLALHAQVRYAKSIFCLLVKYDTFLSAYEIKNSRAVSIAQTLKFKHFAKNLIRRESMSHSPLYKHKKHQQLNNVHLNMRNTYIYCRLMSHMIKSRLETHVIHSKDQLLVGHKVVHSSTPDFIVSQVKTQLYWHIFICDNKLIYKYTPCLFK